MTSDATSLAKSWTLVSENQKLTNSLKYDIKLEIYITKRSLSIFLESDFSKKMHLKNMNQFI